MFFSRFAKMDPVTSRSNSGFLMMSIKAKNSSSSLDEITIPDQVAFEASVFNGVQDHQ